MCDELHRQTPPCPAAANLFAVPLPFVGVRAETVMDVQRKHTQTEWPGRDQCGMKQRRRIAAAAVRDRNDSGRRRAGVSARWCR